MRSIQSSSRKFLVGSAASNALAHHPVLQEMIASCLGRSAASSGAAHECLCAAAAGVGALPLPSDAPHGHPPSTPSASHSQRWPATSTATTSATVPSSRGGGMVETLRGIVRQEGTLSLWRGVDSALLMSVPTVLLYYPLYDHFMHLLSRPSHPAATAPPSSQQQQQRGGVALGAAAPMVAGAASRAITVVAVAPLEYVRTLQQAGVASRAAVAAAGGASGGESTWQTLRSSVGAGLPREGGSGARTQQAAAWAVLRALPRLWTGLSATIARDVPFSAVYW